MWSTIIILAIFSINIPQLQILLKFPWQMEVECM